MALTVLLTTSFPGFSPTRPTERERERERDNRKKKNPKSIGSIRLDDDQLSQDPLDHTNILNGNFAYVGPRLASRIPNSNKINFNGSFVFEPVLSTEIELELMRTSSNKSHGLWSCPTRLLKCARHIIAKPLATHKHFS